MNQSTKLIQKFKINNLVYRKVGRAITKWGAIEKSPILQSQYWKKLSFLKGNKNYFAI